MKVKYRWTRGLSSIQEHGDLLRTLTHQVNQSGVLTKNRLLRSGNLMNWWKLEQGDLFMNNHPVRSQSTRTDSLLKTMIWTLTPSQNQTCRLNPDHSCTRWMIECERYWTILQKMQHKTATWIQLTWKILHGNIYLWLVMKKSLVSRTRRFTYFQILCYVWERWARTHNQTLSERTSWRGSKVHHNTELWTQLMVSQWNSSGILSQDSPHRSSATRVQEFVSKMSEVPEDLTGRIIFMSMFNDITWRSKDNAQECELSAQLVSIYAKRFSPRRWSFLGSGSEKKWYSTHDSKTTRRMWQSRRADDDNIQWKRIPSLPLKSKGGGKLTIHSALTGERLNLFFEQVFLFIISVFTEQSQICVKNTNLAMLEEGDSVMVGQSDSLFVPKSSLMRTHTLSTDGPAQKDQLHKDQERVDKLSQQNRVIKICIDAGFLTMVDVG